MPRTIALTIFILLISTTAFAQSATQLNQDPAKVKFVTSDIGNFWRAYDLAAKETDKAKRVAIFQTEYLDKGSPGLKDFLRLRIKSAEDLVKAIDSMPKYMRRVECDRKRFGDQRSRWAGVTRPIRELNPIQDRLDC